MRVTRAVKNFGSAGECCQRPPVQGRNGQRATEGAGLGIFSDSNFGRRAILFQWPMRKHREVTARAEAERRLHRDAVRALSELAFRRERILRQAVRSAIDGTCARRFETTKPDARVGLAYCVR